MLTNDDLSEDPKGLPSSQEKERNDAGNSLPRHCKDSEFPKKGTSESWVPFDRAGYKQGFPCGQNVGENSPKGTSHMNLGKRFNSMP